MRLVTAQKTRFARRAIALVAGAWLALATKPALASETYPGFVQKAADMPCVPQCTLCHSSSPGRAGTAATGTKSASQFILAGPILGNGSEQQVVAALQNMANAQIDSDGDGTNDFDELKAGTDPNDPQNGSLCGPTYGCGARIAKAPPTDGAASALAALTVVGFAFAFRRIARSGR